MRVGQKNKLTYRWARTGSRPRAIHDQRTQSTYLFGAVCPERGTGAALVLPFCNTEAMQLHLDEIAARVTAGAHAILILDQAGWHGAKDLKISHQPIAPAAAAACAGAQPPRKHLAVHATELAVQSHLQILRRYRRSLLLRLEHADRSALENHVHRTPRLGNRRSANLRVGITSRARFSIGGGAVSLCPVWGGGYLIEFFFHCYHCLQWSPPPILPHLPKKNCRRRASAVGGRGR